jgi:hypothetical protein
MASITQYRDKTWRAQIRRVGYTPISKTFPTKREAQIWVRQIELGMDQHRAPPVKSAQTVGQVFEKFRDEVSPTRKGQRWETVRINMLLRADFTRRRLDQVSPADIRTWRDKRLTEVAPASVYREMNLISGVFSHAIKEWSLMTANPVRLVSRPKGRGNERTQRWSPDETKRFLAACEWQEGVTPTTGHAHVPWAVLICIETAMRLGEVAGLRKSDVNIEERWVNLSDTKNGDGRTVPLTRRAAELFACLLAGKEPGDPLFPVGKETLGVYFREYRKKANLPNHHFHDTRHEATTRLAPKFSNALELSAVTGHRSLQSLKRYYNPTTTELVKRLDADADD